MKHNKGMRSILFNMIFMTLIISGGLWANPEVSFKSLGWSFGLFELAITGLVLAISLPLSRISFMREKNSTDEDYEKYVRKFSTTSILVLTVSGSILEEIFFRGCLQSSIGIVFASIVFAGVHWPQSRSWRTMTFLLLTGLMYGAAYILTGSLLVPMIAHMLHNIVSTIANHMLWNVQDNIDHVIANSASQ